MKKYFIYSLLFVLWANPVSAFSVEHQFTVFLGPFNASQTKFSYTLSAQNYAVNSAVRTAGLFDSLYPFKADYSTSGKIDGERLVTASYRYSSRSRFNHRGKELVYDEDGRPVYRISSKNDKTKRTAVEQNPTNDNTTDLQTVFAALSRQYNQVKFCDSRHEVFDGKRRFDVIFKDEGKTDLAVSEYSPFAGSATKCSMYIDKLGAKGDDLLWELTSDRPVYFWIMEDAASGKPFIARINIEDTPLGRLDVYTSQIVVKE